MVKSLLNRWSRSPASDRGEAESHWLDRKDPSQHLKGDQKKVLMAAQLRKQTTVGWKWIA